MYAQSANARTLLAMVIAASLFAGATQANDNRVIVSKQISTAGLDLGNPADAQTLYMRLRQAADFVCTRGMRADLLPSDDPRGCFEKALGKAVGQAHAPLVTQAYLVNHTLHDAATWGIELPAELATRYRPRQIAAGSRPVTDFAAMKGGVNPGRRPAWRSGCAS